MDRHAKGSLIEGMSGAGQEQLVLVAKALADPVRVRILTMLAGGRDCCGLSAGGTGSEDDSRGGICVCELQECCGLGQSKASYHLRVLKEAGLVRERVRGKWTFYALDERAIAEFIVSIERRFNLAPPGGK